MTTTHGIPSPLLHGPVQTSLLGTSSPSHMDVFELAWIGSPPPYYIVTSGPPLLSRGPVQSYPSVSKRVVGLRLKCFLVLYISNTNTEQ